LITTVIDQVFKRRYVIVAAVLGFAALIVALLAGGGAPTRSAPGLPDAGLTVGWFVPLLTMLNFLIEFALVGYSLASVFFFRDEDGALGIAATRFIRRVPAIAMLWLAVNFVLLIFKAAYEIGIPLREVLNFPTLYSYATQAPQGTAVLWQFFIIALLMSVSALSYRVRGAATTLLLSLLIFLPPAINSHASGAGNHGIAIGAIMVHIAASALWVSGVFALIAMHRSKITLETALPRFSTLALWCVSVIAITGVISAWLHVGSFHAVTSKYGLLVLAKSMALLLLIVIGARHRSAIKSRVIDGSGVAFIRLVSVEIMILVIATGTAVALAQTPPPLLRVPISYPSAELIVGSPMPPRPTLAHLLWRFNPDGFALAFILISAILYFQGVRKLARRGDHWPVGRSLGFGIGLAIFGYATSGGLGDYAQFAFSFHMIAHMTIVTLVPIGLVLGAPVTLALRALPAGSQQGELGARGILNAAIHSKVARFYAHPVIALIIFDGSLFVLYLTPIFGHLMRSHIGHVLMNFHFLAAGIVFFYIIIGVDPSPRRVPHLVRIVLLFAAMSIHAFFSIAIMSTTGLLDAGYFASLQRPWWTDLLNDQHTGGGIGWSMGEAPIIIALIALFIQWTKDDAREAKRLDRASDRAVSRGEDDELAKYNSHLAALAKRDQRPNG
jgi:cytochrome c oxidase assembly factor CtaG/putative copper export protein